MLVFAVLLTVLMLTVVITDFMRFTIPNWLVLIILAFYPALVFFAHPHPDWLMAAGIGALTFGAGFILFLLRVVGGGDVKLLAVAALYAGKDEFLDFIIGMALIGGALSLALIVVRPIVRQLFSGKLPAQLPKVLSVGEPVPYGIAIAASFLILLWLGKIPGIVL